MSQSASAFDELSGAQKLIYDAPHMANTESGQTIVYHYQGTRATEKPLRDTVILSVTGKVDAERRDVAIEFLSDANEVVMPEFPGYRGNPVIIAMLEHVARSLGQQTGGGALYFRNRIRDALAAEKTRVTREEQEVAGKAVEASVVEFKPFTGEQLPVALAGHRIVDLSSELQRHGTRRADRHRGCH